MDMIETVIMPSIVGTVIGTANGILLQRKAHRKEIFWTTFLLTAVMSAVFYIQPEDDPTSISLWTIVLLPPIAYGYLNVYVLRRHMISQAKKRRACFSQ